MTLALLPLLCKQDVQRKGEDQQLKCDGLMLRSVRGLREGRLLLFNVTFCLHKHPLPLFFLFLSSLIIHSLSLSV